MNSRKKYLLKRNMGTTLIEMVVAFALLGIFLVAAASIISNVTGMYYNVKAETYSKQVSDIVLKKVAFEIEGAEWVDVNTDNLKIISSADLSKARKNASGADNVKEAESGVGSGVLLYDRTDSRVLLYAEDDELIVHYYEIKQGTRYYNATDWKFSDRVYNGFKVEKMDFVRGDKLDSLDESIKETYHLTTTGTYGSNVIVVLLKLNSERYGEYYSYRFVKMYNAPDTVNVSPSPAP